MAIEKYIIDKSDLTALLRGECLATQPKGNIRGFCVEIAGNLTNGDMIKAMFPNAEYNEHERFVRIWSKNDGNDYVFEILMSFWNSPYRKEQE